MPLGLEIKYMSEYCAYYYYRVNDNNCTDKSYFQLQNMSCYLLSLYHSICFIHLPMNIKHTSKDVI